MITFPCAKINLGLNIISKREDGFHNLETVFYPIPMTDAIEIKYMGEEFPSNMRCDLKVTGNAIDCNEEDNLVIRAYELLSKDYKLPRIHAHLYKHIPSQAGLGGGSSNAAFMIKLLDERFRLNIGNAEMERYAAHLGADCAFFISSEPSFAQGIGDELEPADEPKGNLRGYHLIIVKPAFAVSTKDAYSSITPKKPKKCCRDIIRQPISTWRDELVNDFEEPVFKKYPELNVIKEKIYALGANYASMSGSGSAIYGIFRDKPNFGKEEFQGCFFETLNL